MLGWKVNGWWKSEEQYTVADLEIMTMPGCNAIGLTPAILYDLYHPEFS